MEKKQFLEIGKIVAVQGLKGEVRVTPWCDSAEFFCGFQTLYFDRGNTPVIIERSRPHKNIILVKVKGVDSVEDAQLLRGKIFYMDRNDTVLDDGTFFVQDLIGLDVADIDDGTLYGKLSDVLSTGANDVYSVKGENREYLIPAIPDVIIKTDIENGKMYIRKLDGLFD